MADSDGVADTALVIALVALLIAVGQFLQQIFSTAEGYRHCQPSVLGPWAKRTRLVWRWTQFRFEVKFTSANIVMDSMAVKHQISHGPPQTIDVKPKVVALDATGAPDLKVQVRTNLDTDTVSWIKLLRSLELQQWAAFKDISTPDLVLSVPAMTLQEWSWDLMPPEVSRPTATTTIGTLVVLAHRLGMVWRDLRPSEGFLRAEGNGQSLNATIVRGFGLLVQYNVEDGIFRNSLTSASGSNGTTLRIPTEAADKMGCGIVPGCPELMVPDTACVFRSDAADTDTDLSTAVAGLRNFGIPSDVAQDMVDPGYWHGSMYDFLFMCMPFMSPYGGGAIEVFDPFRGDQSASYLRSREMRIVFRARLKERITAQRADPPTPSQQQLTRLSAHLDHFASKYPDLFFNSLTYDDRTRYPTAEILDYLHTTHDELTEWFRQTQTQEKGLKYKDLVSCHLACNARSWHTADANIESGRHRDDESLVDGPRGPSYVEVAHIYADNVDAVVDRLVKNGCPRSELLTAAVWTLLVRAVYGGVAVVFLPENTHGAVDADFWDSRTPVYIT